MTSHGIRKASIADAWYRMHIEKLRRIERGYSPVEPATFVEKAWYIACTFVLAVRLLAFRIKAPGHRGVTN